VRRSVRRSSVATRRQWSPSAQQPRRRGGLAARRGSPVGVVVRTAAFRWGCAWCALLLSLTPGLRPRKHCYWDTASPGLRRTVTPFVSRRARGGNPGHIARLTPAPRGSVPAGLRVRPPWRGSGCGRTAPAVRTPTVTGGSGGCPGVRSRGLTGRTHTACAGRPRSRC
jgi:hypothetical protein